MRMRVIACGALATELRAVLDVAGLRDAVDVTYLPAHLHNRPERIVPEVTAALDRVDGVDGFGDPEPTLVAYADCGTGGHLDALLDTRPGTTRLPGAHCYEMFAGHHEFARLSEEEPGTFFLTDFLARHFRALVWEGLGLDRHPELATMYFGNYRRVVLLTQSDDPAVVTAGRDAARQLDLAFEHRHVGRAGLATAVSVALAPRQRVA